MFVYVTYRLHVEVVLGIDTGEIIDVPERRVGLVI